MFAVGDISAKAARDMGFADVASAGGNVNDLAKLVAARLKPPARLLYLAGEERSGDLAGALRAKNFDVDLVVVYRVVSRRNCFHSPPRRRWRLKSMGSCISPVPVRRRFSRRRAIRNCWMRR